MKKLSLFAIISILIAVSAYLFLNNFLFKQKINQQNRINIAVSILPQTYFVKAIGKDKVSVFEIVPPGAEPATYEPLPMQISRLSYADIYFTIGVPFEKRFLTKIKGDLKKTHFIATDTDIEKIKMAHHHHEGADNDSNHEAGEKDPHIWLDPQLVKVQATSVYKGLAAYDPKNESFYKKNLDDFNKEMDELNNYIENKLSHIKGASFIVFHPVWGYFTKRYGLKQIAIEVEGKEPSPADIEKIISEAGEENAQAIFLQKQFSRKSGERIGEAVGLKPLFLDPLSDDYVNNMKYIADTMSKELKKENKFEK